ncbi:uncharacterized protein LOC130691834 [Daphnia carinata]|uniref:uncharacterized protein LOC130691834 n=1 Tax=Daphnia carinata TaxID=120202 RepID=UPI00257E8E1A|nr:uncharacterized protein LOC130691834 [Daphnia carinata]XP_059353524.1 uncharacterized protein LOC130691834 [Daphnia carinata]
MGNKHSHDESDGDDKSHLGTLRDFLKAKSPVLSPSSKRNIKEEAGDHGPACQITNITSNLSDRDSMNKQAGVDSSYTESGVASSSKPDGITKLAKELIIRTQNQDTKDGISLSMFCKYVCHGCVHLGQALFRDFFKLGKNSKKSPNKQVLSKEQFVMGSQKIVQLIGEEPLLTFYIQIFASEDDALSHDDVSQFLQSCYQLSLGTTTSMEHSEEIIQMVITAMFHGKSSLSSKYVVHWVQENCPRVVTWMHRHLVHRLTVGFRILQQNREAKIEVEHDTDLATNIETPVLATTRRDSLSLFPCSPVSPIGTEFSLQRQSDQSQADIEQVISETRLHPMQIWLLGCTLPLVYTRPVPALPSSPSINGIVLMDPHTFISRMLASHSPSNWTTLYNSDNDGLSLNRFEHHVMGYRGPTVSFLYAEGDRIFCLAVDLAWKESIQFWGTPNTITVQLTPEYRVIDRGESMMYYNTSVRGYPFGIQVGTDHRHPCIEIDKEFSRLSYRKIPYRLEAIQVWGCGTSQQRESQLEYKKWELKQVEKSRDVKLSAVDWNDHPDKCLLEMASHRPNYSQFGNA